MMSFSAVLQTVGGCGQTKPAAPETQGIKIMGKTHKKKGKDYEKNEKVFSHDVSHGDGSWDVGDGNGGSRKSWSSQ